MMGSAEAESCVDEVGFFFFKMMKMGSTEAESCVDEVGFFFFRMMKMGSAEGPLNIGSLPSHLHP